MRSPWQKIGDAWNDLEVWSQFGLVFISTVFLICSGLQVLP